MEDKLRIFSLKELKNMDTICFKLLEKSTQIKTDSIFFGCALKYILLGQKGVEGQGDKNEAIIARYRKDNLKGIEKIDEYKKHFGINNLVIQENKGFYEIRRKSSLFNPLACFFLIVDDLSIEASKINDKKTHIITKKYRLKTKLFEAFNGDKDTLKTDNFIFVNYNNTRELDKDVTKALKRIGVKKENIKIRRVNYDRNEFEEWECPEYKDGLEFVDFPYELFYKDREFRYQKECRIVVDDKNWTFDIEDYYNEKLKVFNDTVGQLNKCINVSVKDTFKIIKDIEIDNEGIRVKMEIPLTKYTLLF